MDHDRNPSERRRLSPAWPGRARRSAISTRQTFDEFWDSAALQPLRDEFERAHPGLDCLNCTIRRSANDPDDDFGYRKLAVPGVV